MIVVVTYALSETTPAPLAPLVPLARGSRTVCVHPDLVLPLTLLAFEVLRGGRAAGGGIIEGAHNKGCLQKVHVHLHVSGVYPRTSRNVTIFMWGVSSLVGPALGSALGHVLGHVDFHEGQLRQGLAGYLRIRETGENGEI